MLGGLCEPGNVDRKAKARNGNGAAQPPRSDASVERDQTAVLSSRSRAICCSFGITETSRSRNVILALS